MKPLNQTQKKRFKKANCVSIYLCGPIKDCKPPEIHEWRDNLQRILAPYPITWYNPARRDFTSLLDTSSPEDLEIIDESIVTLDKDEIHKSDILICNLFKPSAGSSMEIYLGWTLGKYIISIVPSFAQTSPWIRYHSTIVTEKDRPVEYYLRKLCPKVFEGKE